MRRWFGWAAVLVVAAGVLAAGEAVASAGTDTAAARCTGTVKITSLAFAPPAVAPGQASTATLVARNCTRHTQRATSYWYGRFVGAGTGIPAGCQVIDPFGRPATFTPRGSVTLSTTYRVFPSCTATSLQLTVRIVGAGGTQLASATATLAIR